MLIFELLVFLILVILCYVELNLMISVLYSSGGRSSSKVPRLVLPNDLFVNIALTIGSEINRGLGFIQDVACGGNLKQFLVVS